MPVTPAHQQLYRAAREDGLSISAAARLSKISRGTAYAIERRDPPGPPKPRKPKSAPDPKYPIRTSEPWPEPEPEPPVIWEKKPRAPRRQRATMSVAGNGVTGDADQEKKALVLELLGRGHSLAQCGRKAMLSPDTVRVIADQALEDGLLVPPPPPDPEAAARALVDFDFFRQRYFGRVVMPWQSDAGRTLADLKRTSHKEFVVLNVFPGSGKPVGEDVLVLMADGTRKRLAEVEVGDWVITHEGNPARVGAVHEQGVLPVFRVRDGWGRETVAAGDHPFITTEGDVKAECLSGYEAPWALEPQTVHGTSIGRAEAFMLGYFIGDGCVSSGNVSITNADPGVIEHIRECAIALGWPETVIKQQNNCASVIKFGTMRGEFRGRCRDWLKTHRLWAVDSRTKRIPEAIFRAAPDRIACFLAGYFDTDGYLGDNGSAITLSSVSPELLRGAQHLLARLGIRSHTGIKRGRYNGEAHYSTILTVIDRARFRELIPLHHSVKKDRVLGARNPDPRYDTRTKPKTIAVTPDGYAKCRCLTVEHADHSFLADDFPVRNTTLFPHDLVAWFAVQDRSLRILIGSRTLRQAQMYTNRLRRTFSRLTPAPVDPEDVAKGLAVEPAGCLTEDFGRFAPIGREEMWTADQFVLFQWGRAVAEKEATFTAFGMDSGFLGGRYDIVVWDDLVDHKVLRTQEGREALIRLYEDEVENRLDPGGLLVLQGQRMRTDDLYRHCVSADAIALTGRGAVAMRDVRVGDRVLTRDGYREVEWSGGTGWKPTVTIETESGRSLALTGDHEVSTPSGWVRADALTPGSDLHVVGPALRFAAQVGGATAGVAARSAMPPTLAIEPGVLDGVGVPGAAVVAPGELTDAFTPPHVPAVVLADQMLRSNAGRSVTQVRRLVAVGNRGTAEQVVTDNHPRDQLPRLDGLPAVDTVRSVTHTGTVEVWDLTVNKTHEFYANGLLVHNCLDMRTEVDPEAGFDGVPKYQHIVYRAHHEDLCRGIETHGAEVAKPWPEGCLLDPIRLPWREVSTIRANREEKWAVLYQQEDVDPDKVLVQRVWVDGGINPVTGEKHPGCWDHDRGLAEIPRGLSQPWMSIATCDPSPTRYWSIQWWLVEKATERRYLLDLVRQPMEIDDFLDWDYGRARFTGFMEDWQRRSIALGVPISHWIIEINATRFLHQHDHWKRFQALHRVALVPHTTQSNRNDKDFGVQTIGPHYKFGRVRLPGKTKVDGGSAPARQTAMRLVDEVTRFPDSSTDDCVLAHWFLEWNLPRITPRQATKPKAPRPSWLGSTPASLKR